MTVDNQQMTRRELLGAGAAGLVMLGAAGSMRAGQLPPEVAERGRPPLPSAYRKAILASAPLAWWRLGETMGPTAFDEMKKHPGKYRGPMGFGRPGAIKSGPNKAIEVKAKAWVEAPDRKAFSQPTSGAGLSVEAWMRPDKNLAFDGQGDAPEGPYVHWLGKGGPAAQEWALRFYSKKSKTRPNWVSAYVFNAAGGLGAGAHFKGPVKALEWLHVVACFEPGDKNMPQAGVRLYVNGVLRQGPPAAGTLYSSFGIVPRHGKAPVRLGTRDLLSFLHGGLDEVAIYGRVLRPGEVMAHWKAAQ